MDTVRRPRPCTAGTASSPFPPRQFAALALATDPADPESLERKPDRKTAPLISVQMWIMIIGQAIYQIVVALVLNFAGHAIFGFDSSDPGQRIDQDNELSTLIFNAFVFSQIFNMLNARRVRGELSGTASTMLTFLFDSLTASSTFLSAFTATSGSCSSLQSVRPVPSSLLRFLC